VVQHLVGLLVAFVELLEAEAERLKLGLRKFLVMGAVIAVAAVVGAAFLLTASVFLVWALFLALAPVMHDALAALVTGLVVWLLIGGGAWLAINQVRKK
jgi:hypothetical protein